MNAGNFIDINKFYEKINDSLYQLDKVNTVGYTGKFMAIAYDNLMQMRYALEEASKLAEEQKSKQESESKKEETQDVE